MASYLESQLKLHVVVVKREVGVMKNVCKIGQFLLQGITHEGMPGIPIVLVCSVLSMYDKIFNKVPPSFMRHNF